MLQKPGKDPSASKKYRPISLLSCIGKIFEKLIRENLRNSLKLLSFGNIYQAGYKSGRSCQEHLIRLSESIYSSFKSKKCTLAVFLDVETAFDSLWHNCLKYKLSKMGLLIKLVRILSSFISNRRLHVMVGGEQSTEVLLRAGSAQGAILSLDLYNIYSYNIPLETPKVDPSQFADDSGFWTINICPRLAEGDMQESLNKTETWCTQWRVIYDIIPSHNYYHPVYALPDPQT